MEESLSRTALLVGEHAVEKLAACRVAVFGLGGVGGYAVEALVRGGVGALDLIDSDCFTVSNLNRQLHATRRTVGMHKVDAVRDRVLEINPNAVVRTHCLFYTPETAGELPLSDYDYIVDAVDTVSAKLELAVRAKACGTLIVSSMGTGNKLDPTALEVADITETSVCPLARVMRRELKKRGVEHLKVVYSKEPPMTPALPPQEDPDTHRRRAVPGSTSFVPPVAGLILAGEVLRDLMGFPRK